jgi:hypothetical protein
MLFPRITPRRIFLALVIGAIGCGGTGPKCEQDPYDGLYIWCKGHDALYYINNQGRQVDKVSLCLDETLLNETGVGGTGSEIELAEWINDAEDLNFLRTACEEKCKQLTWDPDNSKCSPYDGNIWQIENYNGDPTPDPLMEIHDPWHLHCWASGATLAPSPWETLVIPAGASIAWPGTSEYVTLDCENFDTCATHFYAPIGEGLYYDDTAEFWGADMGFADYLATTSATSSRLELRISNSEGAPSSDMQDVDGRIEYSAPDCGKTKCPFYLANFTVSNMEDTWGLYSEDIGADIYINNITVQLRRPTLGVWKPSTNQIYVGPERMDIYVWVTHQIGGESPVEGGYLVTNADAIFGEIDPGGGIQILDLVAGDGSNVELEADLRYDTLAGEPPIADHGMENAVMAPSVDGLPVSSLTDASSDPDDDIEEKIWFVDGVERVSSYVIPPGSHTFALRVIDERGATDVDESVVEVLSP